jgi:hypothetical protein
MVFSVDDGKESIQFLDKSDEIPVCGVASDDTHVLLIPHPIQDS